MAEQPWLDGGEPGKLSLVVSTLFWDSSNTSSLWTRLSWPEGQRQYQVKEHKVMSSLKHWLQDTELFPDWAGKPHQAYPWPGIQTGRSEQEDGGAGSACSGEAVEDRQDYLLWSRWGTTNAQPAGQAGGEVIFQLLQYSSARWSPL